MAAECLNQLLELIDEPGLADLGPGPRTGVESLASLNQRIDSIFAAVSRPRNAELIRSLILLWHDHLDASHNISQGENNSDGSLVHAIMHRREPDYSNAKYWWRSTGDHPCFPAIAKTIAPTIASDTVLAGQILPSGKWDPFAFTDAVQSGIRKPVDDSRHQLLKEIQKAETAAVLEHLLT